MDDLEIAKQRLKTKKLSLIFVKHSEIIFETNAEGLNGFLQAMEKLSDKLADSAVADKTIGKAAALLCAYAKVKAAYAITLSQSGLGILKTHNIRYEHETLVPTILNLKKTDKCPFEKLVENITKPEEAYKKLRHVCTAKPTESSKG